MLQHKKVNLIIMAAGYGSRMSPLTWTTPKPLLKLYDEVLIERLITQAKEAGLEEVIVITGYLSQKFDYLTELFGDFVKLVYNKYYDQHNNVMSVYCAKDYLQNSIISVGDVYYVDNPFLENFSESIYWIKSSVDNNPPTSYDPLVNDYSVVIENDYITDIIMQKTTSKYSIYSMFYVTDKETYSLIELLDSYYDVIINKQDLSLSQYYISSMIALNIKQFCFKPLMTNTEKALTFNTFFELQKYDKSSYNMENSILSDIAKTLHTTVDLLEDVKFYPLAYKSYHKHITFSFNGNKYFCKNLNYNMISAEMMERLKTSDTYHYYETLITSISHTGDYLNNINKRVDILPSTQVCHTGNYELHKFITREQQQTSLMSGVRTAFTTIETTFIIFDKLKRINLELQKNKIDLSLIPTLLNRFQMFNDLICTMYNLTSISDYKTKLFEYHYLTNTVQKILEHKSNHVLLHCDVVNVNILHTKDKTILIDWEYAQLGYDINLDIFNQFIYYTDTTVDDLKRFCTQLKMEFHPQDIYEFILINLYKRIQYYIVMDKLEYMETATLHTLTLLGELKKCNI